MVGAGTATAGPARARRARSQRLTGVLGVRSTIPNAITAFQLMTSRQTMSKNTFSSAVLFMYNEVSGSIDWNGIAERRSRFALQSSAWGTS